MECHYCHIKGHFAKDCYALKNKEKDNAKSKGYGHGRQSNGPSSLVEIGEVNPTCDEIDILVLVDVSKHVEVNIVFSSSHMWFKCYEANQ